MNTLTKYFPWVVVVGFTLYAAAKVYPKREVYKEFDLSAFGSVPVLDGGRVKPLDSIARTNMLFISGRSDFEDAKGDTRPAVLWLLETLAWGDPSSGPAADYRVFRIDNEQLLAELKLEERPGSYRYSWNEIGKNAARFDKLYVAARGMDEKKRDLLHTKVLELAERMARYEALATGRAPTLIPLTRGGEEWASLADIDQRITPPGAARDAQNRAIQDLERELTGKGIDLQQLPEAELIQRVRQRAKVLLREYLQAERKTASPPAAAFHEILSAYRDNKPKGFATAVATYRGEHVEPLHPTFRDTTKFEAGFNAASPFFVAALMYVFAGVFMAMSWLGWSEPLRRAAMGLACVALTLHVAGLLGRMYLMGRPLVFVTNLYSSAVLIGAAAVAGCLVLERLLKNGVGLVVGTTIGAVTVKIAHHLSTDGKDTLGNLVAVLDTNFWLASHVTTVTLGYSATYIAGALGVVYILWGLFFKTLTREKHVALGNMIYGVTCFAMLLSFIGTVLGGIWADQSWGRFWGWDPKENGAVLIVIWNALILHARWGGMVRQRGLAVLAVVGIMITTWSWFGTNQLEVGLHNYGFNKTLAEGCMWTWIASGVVIGLGLVPPRYWRSFAGTGLPRAEGAPTPPPKPVSPDPAAVQQQQASQRPAPVANGSPNGPQPQPSRKKARRRQ